MWRLTLKYVLFPFRRSRITLAMRPTEASSDDRYRATPSSKVRRSPRCTLSAMDWRPLIREELYCKSRGRKGSQRHRRGSILQETHHRRRGDRRQKNAVSIMTCCIEQTFHLRSADNRETVRRRRTQACPDLADREVRGMR